MAEVHAGHHASKFFKPGDRIRRVRAYRSYSVDLEPGHEGVVVSVRDYDYPLMVQLDDFERPIRVHHVGWEIVSHAS